MLLFKKNIRNLFVKFFGGFYQHAESFQLYI